MKNRLGIEKKQPFRFGRNSQRRVLVHRCRTCMIICNYTFLSRVSVTKYNKLKYQHPLIYSTTRARNRQRNIIWYNPLFSKNVSTNIGQIFLKIIDEEFPAGHPPTQNFQPQYS